LPHRDRKGMFWVPQQLWKFRKAPFGVWTVCIHPPDKLYRNADFLRQCIRDHKASITCMQAVVQEYAHRKHSLLDTSFARLWRAAIRVKTGTIAGGSHPSVMPVVAPIESDSGARPGLNTAQ
jgi:hypothetical protein